MIAAALAAGAALVAAALAPGTPARGTPEPASERVVFCAARAELCAAPGAALGTSARGFWTLIGDRALLASAAPLPPVLYFSAEDYQRAIAGLSAREREEAVLHRLELVAADPAPRVFGLLQSDLLQVAAAVQDRGGADLDRLLEGAAIAGGGDDRLRGSAPGAVLKDSRDSLASLAVEVPNGPAAVGYGKEAAALAQLEVDLQHDPRLSALPFAEPEPAYFVASIPRATYRELLQLGRPIFPWRDGVVTTLTPRERAQSPWKNRTARLVYPGRAPFLDDTANLTEAQLDRRLRARLAGVSRQEHADFLAARAFDHAVRLRLFTYPLREAQVSWLSRWNAAVALDTESLRVALAAAQPQTRTLPAPRAVRLARLRADLALASRVLRGAPHADRHLALLARLAALVARLGD